MIGRFVANKILHARSNDGSDNPLPYTPDAGETEDRDRASEEAIDSLFGLADLF